MTRRKGEGSFFYSAAQDRWIGKDPKKRVIAISKDEVKARAAWIAGMEEYRAGVTKSSVTVGELFDSLLVLKESEGVKTRWHRDMRAKHFDTRSPYFARPLSEVKAVDLDESDIEAWLAERASTLSRDSMKKLVGLLAQALDRGRRGRKKALTHNAAREAVVPRSTKAPAGAKSEILDWEETGRLLAVVEEDRLAAWFHLILSVGLRPHEAQHLTWEDVDFDRGHLTARPAKAKAKTPRTIELPVSVLTRMQDHRKLLEEEALLMGDRWPAEHDRLVFRSEAGTPLDAKNQVRKLRALAAKAGIAKTLDQYSLRKTMISLAADAGELPVHLADLVGNDPRTLEAFYRKPVGPVRTVGIDIGASAPK